ncbi:hypothetical protein ESCOCK437M_25485 [Escherichia coli]
MTLNTSQVSYYMTQRKKGITQHISAMKAGISVRSGRRIEKGEWAKNSVRHWRTRKDPLEAVWDSMLVPLLKERPALTPTTLLEMLQDKYPGQSLYIDLCNCLILICSIQHQMKVNLWTKNSYRLWLTNWPKTSKPLKTSVSLIGC